MTSGSTPDGRLWYRYTLSWEQYGELKGKPILAWSIGPGKGCSEAKRCEESCRGGRLHMSSKSAVKVVWIDGWGTHSGPRG